MPINEIKKFFDIYKMFIDDSSNMDAINELSQRSIPDPIIFERKALLRADILKTWSSWFLESIFDYRSLTKLYEKDGYSVILHETTNYVEDRYKSFPPNQRDALSNILSDLIQEEVLKEIIHQKRKPFSMSVKKTLWDIYAPDHRCWICGYKFDNWAINKFFNKNDDCAPPKPIMIDVMKLKGINDRHFKIEIEHVKPLSEGGTKSNDIDNLRLSCGWCNTHKWNRTTLYDASRLPKYIKHPNHGYMYIPQPYWIVRLLSTRKECEWSKGCNRTIKNCELTVCKKNPMGALIPSNLRVTCMDHDSQKHERYVPTDFYLNEDKIDVTNTCLKMSMKLIKK